MFELKWEGLNGQVFRAGFLVLDQASESPRDLYKMQNAEFPDTVGLGGT